MDFFHPQYGCVWFNDVWWSWMFKPLGLMWILGEWRAPNRQPMATHWMLQTRNTKWPPGFRALQALWRMPCCRSTSSSAPLFAAIIPRDWFLDMKNPKKTVETTKTFKNQLLLVLRRPFFAATTGPQQRAGVLARVALTAARHIRQHRIEGAGRQVPQGAAVHRGHQGHHGHPQQGGLQLQGPGRVRVVAHQEATGRGPGRPGAQRKDLMNRANLMVTKLN